jgi:hypothetical protein
MGNKERLFEVMGRLDKTFKPKMNEEFEIGTGEEEIPVETGEEMPAEEPTEEKSVEEKYEELKEKVEELYGMINGDEEEVAPEEPSEPEIETGEEEIAPEEPTGEIELQEEKKK